jgi:hypothetical protein
MAWHEIRNIRQYLHFYTSLSPFWYLPLSANLVAVEFRAWSLLLQHPIPRPLGRTRLGRTRPGWIPPV